MKKRLYTYEVYVKTAFADADMPTIDNRVGWRKTFKAASALIMILSKKEDYHSIWIKRRPRRKNDFNY